MNDFKTMDYKISCNCFKCTMRNITDAIEEVPPNFDKIQVVLFKFDLNKQDEFLEKSEIVKMKKLEQLVKERNLNEICALVEELHYTTDYYYDKDMITKSFDDIISKGKKLPKRIHLHDPRKNMKLIKGYQQNTTSVKN